MEFTVLERAIIKQVAGRPNRAGYDPVLVDGYHAEEISTAVKRLADEAVLHAAFVEGGFGPGQNEWRPSVLTEGFRQASKNTLRDIMVS